MSKFWAARFGSKLRHRLTATSDSFRRSAVTAVSKPKVSSVPTQVPKHENHLQQEEISQDSRIDVACFASSGTVGIVDLGASRTVVGSKQVNEILNGVPTHIRSQIRRTSCNLVFRFGNHQTLSSQHALLFPLHGMWFEVAIVEGNTPFLLSASFLKQIGAVIDVEQNQLWSRVLNRALPVGNSPRNLMMLDINELWETGNQTQEGLVMEAQFQANVKTDISSQVPLKNEHWRRSVDSNTTKAFDQNISRTSPEEYQPSSGAFESKCPANMSRPKFAEPQVNCDLSHFSGVSQHVQPSSENESSCTESQPRGGCTKPRSLSQDAVVRDEPTDCGLRRQISRPELSEGLSGQPLGRVVRVHLHQEQQACPPEVPDLRGEATGCRNWELSEPGQDESQWKQNDLIQDQDPCEGVSRSQSDRMGQCVGGRNAQQSCDGSPGTNDQHAGQSPQHASEDVWDRECDSRPDRSHQGHPGEDRDVRVLRDQEAMSLHALDWANSHLKDLTDPAEVEFEFHASVHPMSFSQEFQKWVTVFEKEINMLRRLNFDSMRSSRLDVLEVMCSENSELTKQVLQLSGSAQRFGLTEGDLQQASDRMRLFRLILLRKPKSLWYSPECGPWSMWNFLNMGNHLNLKRN